MGRSNQDVGGYRGRRTVTDILKFIAIALGVVVVLVLAGLFYVQRYLVYTDDGVRLDLPPFLQMFRREEAPPDGSAPPSGSVSVVVEPSAGGADASGADASLPPVQADVQSAGFALELGLEEVLGGTAAASLAEAGAEALILEMKAPSGQLAWHSELFNADWAEVNAPKSNNDALKQWNQGDVYTIARVCCFRDDSVPYSLNKLALRRGDYNWRDELGLRWLSPAREDARVYLAELCGELGAMGFDEIVLEQFHFPIGGNVDKITRGERYDPDQFSIQLEDLLSRVERAVSPYGTKVSLRVERDTLAGAEDLSGVTAQLLEQHACRIWVEEDGLLPSPLELLEPAGITGGADRLVLISGGRTEGGAVTQAVIPQA